MKSYPERLKEENNIELLEPYKGAKKHHRMRCLICQHEWEATPLSKVQTKKKTGASGCPSCYRAKRKQQYEQSRNNNVQILLSRGIEILDDWNGSRQSNEYTKVHVRNTKCGHDFYCSPTNLLTNNVQCPVCGTENRTKKLVSSSKQRSQQWKKTADQWSLYKSEVYRLTRETCELPPN